MISVDTETTGVDLRHGAQPFFVTTCDGDDNQTWWEWDVDPLTRRVLAPPGDVAEVRRLLGEAPELVLQNSKFDAAALTEALPVLGEWPWAKTHDTLIAAHVLASNMPHDLTSLAIQYLGWDIEPYDKSLEAAVQKCRRWCRTNLKDWLIAKKDLTAPGGRQIMPSAKDKTWKFDTWLPRAVLRHLKEHDPTLYEQEYGDDHPWWVVLREYANADSAATAGVWAAQRRELRRRGLWPNYLARLRAPGIAHDMERRGVTVSAARLRELEEQYREESDSSRRKCVNIAAEHEVECPACNGRGRLGGVGLAPGPRCAGCKGEGRVPYELDMPRGGVNNSLRTFVYDVLRLEGRRAAKSRTGNASLDKHILGYYLAVLPDRCLARTFVSNLAAKRQRDTAVQYMQGYRRFWLPLKGADGRPAPGWYVLHPSLNPTGTFTLRWSSSNPNEQNISKREGFNLRYCFGPAPGREWWSLDAKNIELRIPAYESGEQEFINLFERPDDPPYFGSNHLLIAHLLHPEEFEQCWSCALCSKEVWAPAAGERKEGKFCQCPRPSKVVDGRVFKKRYASTLYQRTKNGNFAVQYGAVDKEDGTGTADRTYGMAGAQARIKARFTKQEALNQHWIRFAERHGYVETMPSAFINPKRGYPIMCSRTEWGRIKPTVPLNYHVQSTAMEWMQSAMIRCHDQLADWRRGGLDGHMILQVHDELVFDLPSSREVRRLPDGRESVAYGNLPKIRVIKKLMEQGGTDIGVPTPVSCEYHASTWAEGVSVL